MARDRGCGKSSGRTNRPIHVSMPTIPMPTIVSPQQGGNLVVETSTKSITPTTFESPLVTPNWDFSTQRNPTGHSNTVAEGDSSRSHTRTLISLTSAGKNFIEMFPLAKVK